MGSRKTAAVFQSGTSVLRLLEIFIHLGIRSHYHERSVLLHEHDQPRLFRLAILHWLQIRNPSTNSCFPCPLWLLAKLRRDGPLLHLLLILFLHDPQTICWQQHSLVAHARSEP